jgi:ATP-binding cassette subfamily B (MDR/TAP) protein 1
MSVLLSVLSLGNIVAPITSMVKSATSASTFFEMIDRPTMSRDGLKDPEVSARNNLSFKNVTFAYPSRPHVKILDNFNAEFESGKLTAIVGPSGSGKSTVVGLIERWYELTADTEEDPFIKSEQLVRKTTRELKDGSSQDEEEHVLKVPIALEGDIFIGEHNLKDVELRFWRSQIGLVQQEPFVFNDTIFANVAYGLVGSKYENEDETGKRAMVQEACKEAFADEFITRLPLVCQK